MTSSSPVQPQPRPLARHEVTSFSRLNAFKDCSQYFYLKYIYGLPEEKPFNKHLHIGAVVHSAIADHLDGGYELDDAFLIHLGRWLTKMGLEFDEEELVEKIAPAAELLWRCSLKCKDPELVIRKENGDLLKDPISYPTQKFKKLCFEEGITQSFSNLDQQASKQNQDFVAESFAWIVARMFYLVRYFQVPGWVKENLFVEVGISTNTENRVSIPGTRVALQGYIDWVVRHQDDRVVILDHKTSKKAPTPENVFVDPQLNLYVWLLEQVYGIHADLIGINHLESGEVIATQTDRRVVQSVVDYHRELQQQIEKGVYFKHDPTEYNTPCVKTNWKTGEITESCPFLSSCHPIFAQINGL
ncbi:MAG: PD-(D/E)XK nuclease family protein [Halobacteria archaeon]